jgi:FHS family L-fucose permease-like MFS transporter
VGTEVSIGVNVNLHAMELIDAGHGLSFFGKDHLILWGLDLGIPALLATLYWGGFMVGRMTFSFFDSISPRKLLAVTTIIAAAQIVVAMVTNNLWILVSVGLCHSVMWSCIFTLSIKGLKKYTSKASGVFMMGVFGGAVFPVLQGVFADAVGSWQWTWIIALVCELVMLYYALWGCRIKDAECMD